MEIYVVYEMSLERDIMIAVFLDEQDAYQFAKTSVDNRYVVPVPTVEDVTKSWYNLKEKSIEAIDDLYKMSDM